MRVILDTDKKTITVPWNYQKKLQEINQIIMDATGDESKKKTFIGYIDEIWKEAISKSDEGVVTGNSLRRPPKRSNNYGSPAEVARWGGASAMPAGIFK